MASESSVQIVDGAALGAPTRALAGSCGLDFWLSADGCRWLEAVLHARAFTLRVSDGARSAELLLLRRRLLPGIDLASGHPYSAICGDAPLFWERIGEVRRACRAAGISRIELPFSGEETAASLVPSARAFVPAPGREVAPAVRHVIALHAFPSTQALEAAYPANLRWALRKAAKSGAAVRGVGAESATQAQQLYAQTMRAKGAPVNYGVERFELIAGPLAAAGAGALYVGTVNGEPAGMAAAIDSAQARHLVQLAVPERFQSSRLGDLLAATAINAAHAAG